MSIRIMSTGSIEGAADPRVIGRDLGVDPGQIQDSGDLPAPTILSPNLVETERIEHLTLVPVDPSPHCPPPRKPSLRRRNHCSQMRATGFCDKIGKLLWQVDRRQR